jgi:arylsulfatase
MRGMVTRRSLFAAAPALWACSRNQNAGREDPRPNILFLFPDQWRHDWTSFTKGLDVRTPVLEEVAERGVRFTNALCPSPLCAPSRACLALGLEYHRSPVPDNKVDLPVDRPNVYRALRDAGYHVMGCGKFDLHKATEDWGLDGKRLLPEWGYSDGIDNAGKFDAIRSGAVTPKDPFMAMLHRRGLAEAHVKDYRGRHPFTSTYPTPLPDNAYCDNWIGQNGIDLIERAPREKPWYLAVNFAGPHDPMDITSTMEKGIRDRQYPLPVNSTEYDAETHQRIGQNYTAMVENLDRWTGNYIDLLKQRGEYENTLIVISSDHGEMLGDRNLWRKRHPWQPSIGVPLVVAGPGVSPERVVDHPVTIMDLAATWLDYAEAPALADADSRTLRPVLESRANTNRDVALSGFGNWRVSFDGRYKLIRTRDSADQLFDLRDDPAETKDLATKLPQHVHRLSAFLA